MKLHQKLRVGITLAAARLLGRRVPLVVGWSLTKRCNLSCRYCGIWRKDHRELTTAQVADLIRQMASAGTRRISFTGGEPLMREDIGEIISHCRRHGITVGMNSNGLLVADRIDELTGLDLLKLSLDGPREVHDAVRGAGTFDGVMKAVAAARSRGIKVNFLSVVSTENAHRLRELVSIAEDCGCRMTFQPATPMELGGTAENPITPRVEFVEVVRELIRMRAKHRAVATSLPVLHHFLTWPEGARITCAGGRVSCRVEPDGRVYHCGRVLVRGVTNDALAVGFRNAFLALPPMACVNCWCAPRLEMNFIYRLSPGAILNIVNSL
ncbi:radical SAM protein [bacterium]|nr:radical SAM protein [candidate division CSSED10-310 bacterium]